MFSGKLPINLTPYMTMNLDNHTGENVVASKPDPLFGFLNLKF